MWSLVGFLIVAAGYAAEVEGLSTKMGSGKLTRGRFTSGRTWR